MRRKWKRVITICTAMLLVITQPGVGELACVMAEQVQEYHQLKASGSDRIDLQPAQENKVVKGKVCNEKGEPVNEAYIQSGSLVTATDKKGEFSVALKPGEEHVLTVRKEGYEEEKITVKNLQENLLQDITLNTASYEVVTEVEGNIGGTVSPGADVEHDGNYTLNIQAAEGYQIQKLFVNGAEDQNAEAKESYTREFTNIQEDLQISVAFIQKPCSIQFTIETIGENEGAGGVVKRGTEIVENRTEIRIVNGGELAFTIEPNIHYHVHSILIDDVPLNLDQANELVAGKNGSYTYQNKSVSKSMKIRIVFEIDMFKVQATVETNGEKDGHGTITYLQKPEESSPWTFPYAKKEEDGPLYQFLIKPDEGYYLSKLLWRKGNDPVANNVETIGAMASNGFTMQNDGSWIWELTSMVEDQEIVAEFSLIPESDENGDEFELSAVGCNELIDGNSKITYILNNDENDTDKDGEVSIEMPQNPNGTPPHVGIVNNGSILFSNKITVTETKEIEEIYVRDIIGNLQGSIRKVILNKKISVIKHKEKPSICEELKKIPEKDYHNERVTLQGKAGTDGAIKYEIRYSEDKKAYENDSYLDLNVNAIEKTQPDSDGNFTIVLQNIPEENNKITYFIWAIDACGNKSECREIEIKYDVTPPTVCIEGETEDYKTPKKEQRICFSAQDSFSSVAKLRFSKSEAAYRDDTESNRADGASDFEWDTGETEHSLDVDEDYHGEYYIWTYDEAGNKSDPAIVEVWKDSQPPEISNVESLGEWAQMEEVTICVDNPGGGERL